MYLVDGGVSNKVPVNVLRDWGSDLRIAINVAPEVDPSFYDPGHPRRLGPLGRTVGLIHRGLRDMYSEPNIFQILGRTYSTSATKATEQHLHLAHITIRPDTSVVGLLDFLKLDEAVEAGMAATRQMGDEIKREVNALLGR
jgi:predicted acylesterase/phospholipase RssA